jgi:hypothetical protein
MTKGTDTTWTAQPAIVVAIAKVAELHGRLVRLRVRKHVAAAQKVLELARGNLK